ARTVSEPRPRLLELSRSGHHGQRRSSERTLTPHRRPGDGGGPPTLGGVARSPRWLGLGPPRPRDARLPRLSARPRPAAARVPPAAARLRPAAARVRPRPRVRGP